MVAKTCESCGEIFHVKPHRTNTARFCSFKCGGKPAAARNFTHEKAPRVTVNCQTCQKPFEIKPSRLKHGRGKSCSRRCQYAAVEKKCSRKVQVTCSGCGVKYLSPPSRVNSPTGKGKFCSRICRDLNRVGEKHPQYLGGPNARRGANWGAQRRKALQRDKQTCQHCGEPARSVHHVKPFRLFTDYREANQLPNLLTLCCPCHRQADAAIQAEDRQQA